jgi:hypothetical protein
MDKIRELLLKCGVSEEAARQICESLDAHATTLRKQLDEEFQTRLVQAKKVCVEETEAYKAELARRLQIFLEAKGAAIEEQLGRQVAQRETAAQAKLERVKALVEGIEIDGQPCSELKAELDQLKRLTAALVEERDLAVGKAQRVQAIAERVLKRNRQLEGAVAEGAPIRKPQRLDTERMGGQRRTTQPTLVESVTRRPVHRAAGSDLSNDSRSHTPEQIAKEVDVV